ncbi:hypothetical protein RI129_012583 [Pyrocoelia pectoralis]|uniref:Uncharacterized protein n=1 Tax=Pyrocoelia pectoralis TaxID=417401 RepID=A0AAN7ZG61_9COLE
MSKSANMLRTRRKDNNVKPNRRLDRKSSRGMLYENEELRLKTININAEVERGQSDIKKLKRENDQLRREIWYLRDEYDKLDKLLREKGSLCSSSSSTYSSDSDSCSSYTEESEAVETSQNIENVNKTHLKKLNEDFDHLSVVQEENSGENSEKNSQSKRCSWTENVQTQNDVIKADQSYPIYATINKDDSVKSPKHFFSPISKPNDDYVNNQFLGPDVPYAEPNYSAEIYYESPQTVQDFPSYFSPTLDKANTDVIVKTDNQNFNTLNSHSSFSNGGNLEELLNDIETISQDILTISNGPNRQFLPYSTLNDDIPQDGNLSYMAAGRVDNYEFVAGEEGKPYKSELNVVLMPTPMKLIEIEKYKNIQKSCESINQKSLENLSHCSFKLSPEILTPSLLIPPHQFCGTPLQPFVPVPPKCPEPRREKREEPNPFFFGTIHQAPTTSDNRDQTWTPKLKETELYGSKANLLDTSHSSDHVSSENEENLKFKTSRVQEPTPQTPNEKLPDQPKSETSKSKSGIKGKVSIHFKGKKDRPPKIKTRESKFFDIKLTGSEKEKKHTLQKTPSIESKTSITPCEPKTPTSADSKTSTSENCDKTPESKGSPERKQSKKVHKRHKKLDRGKNRRRSISTDRYNRERSFSICTDRSNIIDHRIGFCSVYDDFTTSDRERTNSLSSCETLKGRKLSVTHFPTGKIPWCGCWGNGCL